MTAPDNTRLEAIRERGPDPEELRERLADAAGAEFPTRDANLRMHPPNAFRRRADRARVTESI